jgi:carboxymethylenebutenolidase
MRSSRKMAGFEEIAISDKTMRAYVDAPASGGARGGVVLMCHGPGVDAFIHSRVQDLARHGFVAAAPDVYHRQPDDDAGMMTRIARLRDREILADADATIAHLRGRPDPVGPLAVLGFCMGGRNTYLLAGARPDVWSAAVVFYGGSIMKAWGKGPAPFALSERIACPLLGCFGADDTNPSPDDVDRIDAELTRHGKPHVFHRYAGAGHAFLNFTNAERYRAEPAADAWAKALAFLEQHLPR